MTHTEIIIKLIGRIDPVGETNMDNERIDNLRELVDVVNNLLLKINDVAMAHHDSHQFSCKRSGQFAKGFLTQICKDFNPINNE